MSKCIRSSLEVLGPPRQFLKIVAALAKVAMFMQRQWESAQRARGAACAASGQPPMPHCIRRRAQGAGWSG
eukprot:CAMPEP_0195062380 /NCGR_PEP_ID=MMETSP0448-20130528/9023_1 /TAXON_ID=66468 /ORGANISM="Heterocapsa triquestra, Strain CCMP 448" /LENGTH=70 /DNA_ID=CAMNT_0040093061 /DNA_START=1 /DNA_END=209 /DNA_ORIENTATION=+